MDKQKLKQNVSLVLNDLLLRYPKLEACENSICDAFNVMRGLYASDNTLFIIGNGGSAADSEHIAGELLKSFRINRNPDNAVTKYLTDNYGAHGVALANKLEGALKAVPLPSIMGALTAYINDVDPETVYAQLVYAMGRHGDGVLAISTSGNSKNILEACKVARARNMRVIGLTGKSEGKIKAYCDVIIAVPELETHAVQELHLPVYHALCAMIEEEYFGKE